MSRVKDRPRMNTNKYKTAQPIKDLKAKSKKWENMGPDDGINDKYKFVLIRG